MIFKLEVMPTRILFVPGKIHILSANLLGWKERGYFTKYLNKLSVFFIILNN